MEVATLTFAALAHVDKMADSRTRSTNSRRKNSNGSKIRRRNQNVTGDNDDVTRTVHSDLSSQPKGLFSQPVDLKAMDSEGPVQSSGVVDHSGDALGQPNGVIRQPNGLQVQNGVSYQKELVEPDNPCHELADSLFSSSSGFNNYRGMLNLCIILLALSTGRVALENVMKYGILIDPLMWLRVFLADPYHWPTFYLVLAANVFILAGFGVEILLAKKAMSERLGSTLNIINQLAAIVFPAAVVLYVHPNPLISSPALAIYICLFLKLISYQQVNRWCRVSYFTLAAVKKKYQKVVGSTVSTGNGCENKLHRKQVYPENLHLKDLYYFMAAPTLCYELNFPRTRRVRKRFLLKRVGEMIFLCGLILSLIQQWIIPTVNNSLVSFKELNFPGMVERILKLAVPNHLIWLIFFYWLFHSCFNVVAELLHFGDRVFYLDWWNAESVQSFWQTWNIPVHKWAVRHLYKPILSAGYPRIQANIIVFIVSAFFHEYLVSVPLRMFRVWAFMGLLGQVPLTMLTRCYMSSKYGNMVVWLSLIIGNPAIILMYYHDYYVLDRDLSSYDRHPYQPLTNTNVSSTSTIW